MKGGLAAMLYAAKAVQGDIRGRIDLVFVPDEETAGSRGVIWNGNRRAVSLAVTVKGKPAHAGLQHQGVNAFERMIEVASPFVDLKREIPSILLIGGIAESGCTKC